jgi:tight adherence protein B
MDIILIFVLAGSAGGFTWFGFIIYDQVNQVNQVNRESSTIQGNIILIDYSSYTMTKKERFLYCSIAGIILYAIGYVFYQHYVISALIASLGLLYPKLRTKELINKRKQELGLQFKQALYSLSSALGAGKSIENAFREVVNDLRLLYPDPSTHIIREFEIINRSVENGDSIEKAVVNFAERADVEDIHSFADVFVTCKRTGGDLVEVIRSTSNIIGDKLDIQQEIVVLIAQKKLESQILTLAPLAMVALLSYSAPDYMEPMYQFGTGPIIMTIGLVLLGTAFWLSRWIMNIKV